MTDRWMWIGSAGWRIRRIFCSEAMDLVEMLGLRIIGLQVLVRDRPRGRGPTPMLDLAKVLSAEAKECGAVELGVAAHPVVSVWMEIASVGVPPHFSGAVLPLQVDRLRAPVVLLPRHIVATLYQQDAFTGWRQTIRERAASRSRSDNDHVEVFNGRHKVLPYTVTDAFRSNEPTDQRRETAAVGSGPVEPRRQESVHAEAAAGTRQQEDSREHDHHRVGPAPFVWHVQDADRDVRGHADCYQRPQPRAEPEDQGRSDEGLGDQRHPPKESPVRNHDVDQEVLVGGHGGVLDFLLDPVPEAAAGLPAEVV